MYYGLSAGGIVLLRHFASPALASADSTRGGVLGMHDRARLLGGNLTIAEPTSLRTTPCDQLRRLPPGNNLLGLASSSVSRVPRAHPEMPA